mgnify:CR=1 FL=1
MFCLPEIKGGASPIGFHFQDRTGEFVVGKHEPVEGENAVMLQLREIGGKPATSP